MKVSFRFIKRTVQPDSYHKKIRTDCIIQKRGWFGWKTLNEVDDGMWSFHYKWSYFFKPSIQNYYDTFKDKKGCISFLKIKYRKNIKEEGVHK